MASLALWSEVSPEMLVVIGAGYVMSRSLSGLSSDAVFLPRKKRRTWKNLSGTSPSNTGCADIGSLVCSGSGCDASRFRDRRGSGDGRHFWVFWYYHHMAMKQFGGMTGDLGRYFLQLAELSMLAAAVVVGGVL